MPVAGLAGAPEALLVLAPRDAPLAHELVSQRFAELVGGGENDLAVIEIDPFDLITALAVDAPRRTVSMDLHQHLRKRRLGNLSLIERCSRLRRQWHKRTSKRGFYAFFFSSIAAVFFSSRFFRPSRKLEMPSPRPLPSCGSFPAPKTTRMMAKMISSSGTP